MTVPKIKRGDIGVLFTDTLTVDGDPIDLTDATVLFVLRLRGGDTPITGTAEIIDAASGTVAYATAMGDLDVAGFYDQEWEVTYPITGDIFTFPSNGYNPLRILGDLNP